MSSRRKFYVLEKTSTSYSNLEQKEYDLPALPRELDSGLCLGLMTCLVYVMSSSISCLGEDAILGDPSPLEPNRGELGGRPTRSLDLAGTFLSWS